MNKLQKLQKIVFVTVFTMTVVLFLLVILPGHFATVNSQSGWGPTNNQASLNGTNLTYYRGTTAERCQSECGGNLNCKGFTFIRAGAYNRNDPPMCYLMSAVTQFVAHSCCISAIKTVGGGGGGNAGGCRTGSNYSLTVSPNAARPGEKVKIYFRHPGDKPASDDWIGYFPVGSNQYIEWYWVRDLVNCESSFTANRAGNYEFRYLLKGSYDQVAARTNFTVVANE